MPSDQHSASSPRLSLPRLSFAISTTHNLDHDVRVNESKQESLFLYILKPTIVLLKVFGIFPVHKSTLHWKNIWSCLVLAFLFFGYSYIVTFRVVTSAITMFKNWTADTILPFAVCLWFCTTINCLIFALRLGWGKKLENIDRVLNQVTELQGLRKNVFVVRRNYIILFAAMIIFAISISGYVPMITLANFTRQWPGADYIQRMFIGDSWYWQMLLAILTLFNSIVISQTVLIYWYLCYSMTVEFCHLNCDILKTIDAASRDGWRNVAHRQASLINSFKNLSDTTSAFVFTMFSASAMTSTLNAYVLLLDVHPLFRIYGTGWLIASIALNFLYCLPADSLHSEIKKTKEVICVRMLEYSTNSAQNASYEQIQDIAHWMCEQATLDASINALGFFTASKAALLATYSFIATYLVILLQTDWDRSGIDRKASTSAI